MAACWRSNDTGGGGGAVRATTGRFMNAAGGRRTFISGRCPNTLSREGAIAGPAPCTPKRSTSAGGMRCVRPAIDRPETKTSRGTDTTAPCRRWFTYVLLVTRFSYTFVMYVVFTIVVLVMLTFLT